jgi:hypothetical protein
MKQLFLFLLLIVSINAQVNIETMRFSGKKEGIINKIGFNLDYSGGNSNYSIADFEYRIDSYTTSIHNFLVTSVSQGHSDGESIEDKGFIHMRSIYNLNPLRSLELYFQVEYDTFINLKNRTLGGSGFRITHLKNKIWNLYSGHSIMLETEHYENNKVTNLLRLSEYISLSYSSKLSTISIVTYAQPDIGRPEDFKVLSDISWSIPISEHLILKLTSTLKYDNEPEEGLEKLDVESLTGFEYEF